MNDTERSLQDSELHELTRLARKYKWATGEVRDRLENAGVTLARSDFYSEFPSLSDIRGSFEYAGPTSPEKPDAAFDDPSVFDTKRIIKFAKSILAQADEFSAPTTGTEGFYWKNTQFSGLDALAYYGMIKHLKPRKIIEIGSGFSTHIAHKALSELPGDRHLVCIDPSPRTDIAELGGIEFKKQYIQDVSVADAFGDLQAGDMVFYDGSHTIKTGSDTVYFYLKILPYLRKGLMVHAHDVQLPYPRNIKAMTEAKISWGEQYLLLAHLHNHRRYKVQFASGLLCRQVMPEMTAFMAQRYAAYGSSLWFSIEGK